MNVSASKEDPNPKHSLSHDLCSEEADQSILSGRFVDSLQIATEHHVEQKQGDEHEKLFKSTVHHGPSEVLAVHYEELRIPDLRDSTAVDEDEFPRE